MWPFRPRAPQRIEVTVRHEIVGLSELTKAVRAMTTAKRFETKARAGMIEFGRKSEDVAPPEWAKWERENGARFEEPELLHLRWAYDVLRGAEKAPEGKRVEAMNLYARAQAAGYGLPDMDGRKLAAAR